MEPLSAGPCERPRAATRLRAGEPTLSHARHVLVAALLLAASVPLFPETGAAVIWSDPRHALTPAMNATLANNTQLAQTLLDAPPVGSPVSVAIAIAERALDSRRKEFPGETGAERLMRNGIDAERLNLRSAADVHAILTGTDTPRQKAFALAGEGLTSRTELIATTSPRMQGYLDQQGRNVQAAQDVLAAADVFAVVEVATALQAQALAVTVPDSSPDATASPSAALVAYMGAKGLTPTSAQLAEMAPLDALPTATRDALRDVIDAFAKLDKATETAFAAGDPAALQDLLDADDVELHEETTLPLDRAPALDWNGLAAAGVDVGPVLAARADLLVAAKALRVALQASPPAVAVACDSVDGAVLNGVRLYSIDVTACDNTYTEPTALTIDVGGHDNATNNAGGNRLWGGCEEPVTENPDGTTTLHPRAPQTAALLDYAGNDVRAGPPCGLNGGAALGTGLLLDLGGGDDRYLIAGPEPISHNRTVDGEGVNGGGHAGIGLLVDDGGSDVYVGGAYGVNGGSLVGLGILVDGGAGQDEYRATFGGVNGGTNVGAGFLFDGGGDDLYVTEARTANGGALYGVSLLVDAEGDDHYRSVDITVPRYATATIGGAHYAAALLVDALGNDLYEGLRDGTVGGGVDGVGGLIDVGGDDRYRGQDNGTIGSGWGLLPVSNNAGSAEDAVKNGTLLMPGGFGMLVDVLGNDDYHGGMFGTIGGAYLSTSFLVDGFGNDVYYADDGGGSIGGVSGHNKGGGVAFMFDGAGDDRYTTNDTILSDPPRFKKPAPRREFDGKGANGGAAEPGGVGFLFDAGGNDAYTANSTGVNGGASNGAVGMLIDVSGNDWYNASDRGVNGGAYGGGHRSGYASLSVGAPALGFLVDLQGNDRYRGGNQSNPAGTPGQGVNGGGYLAMGFLYDGDGSDRYTAYGLATNGGGAGGVGLLLDDMTASLSRSDHYVSRSWATPADNVIHAANGGASSAPCVGACEARPQEVDDWFGKVVPAGVGLLVDAAGTDSYEDQEPTDYLGSGRDYNGSGWDQCVFPKGEPGAGYQRDSGVDLHVDLTSGCTPTTPGL